MTITPLELPRPTTREAVVYVDRVYLYHDVRRPLEEWIVKVVTFDQEGNWASAHEVRVYGSRAVAAARAAKIAPAGAGVHIYG